jgi:hypothetical protein
MTRQIPVLYGELFPGFGDCAVALKAADYLWILSNRCGIV